jgi:hypothetical protein
LKFGAGTIYITYVFTAITFIVAYPIGAILDKILGEEEGVVLSKSRMKKLFEIYERENLLKPSESKFILFLTLNYREDYVNDFRVVRQKGRIYHDFLI